MEHAATCVPGANACVDGTCEGSDAEASSDARAQEDARESADAGRDGEGDAQEARDAVGDRVADVGQGDGGDAAVDATGERDATGDDGGDALGEDGGDAVGDDGGNIMGEEGGDAIGETDGDLEADTPAPVVCDLGLTPCDSQCVDLTNDPLHCGGCNSVCGSQICENSVCVGSVTGGIVFIGHDYLSTDPYTAQARVLSNAVLIPRANPLRVLSFEEYANPSSITHVSAILHDAALEVGRTLAVTSTVDESAIPSALAAATIDVVLIHDQPGAAPGALAILGSTWAESLAAFTQAGGVVVVLDGGTGTDEMPAFVTATVFLP